MNQMTIDAPITAKTFFHTLLVFRAPTTLSESLAGLAAKRQTSVSAVIRDLLVTGLAREHDEPEAVRTGRTA